MVFSSLQFICVFMPIFFICYYGMPKQMKNIVLLVGSLIFYFIGTINNPEHFLIFVLSIILDFEIGQCMESYPHKKKIFLIIGITFHLICLSIFKYTNFLFNEVFHSNFTLQIVLPIGISFYTFQGISYIVDVYRGKTKAEKSLLRYAVYISMFEQLIAGPIVTYDQVKNELKQRKITFHTMCYGLATFIFGLGLKVLLANPIGKLWSQVGAIGFESISTPLAWLAIFAYSFQIYFDFFGYSLMAIGLGKMLGFHLPQNFNHPYLSLTMIDFWRRWHMTLGSWFREYVYIPLGGNRKGTLCTIRNLIIVWTLTGLWHGAGYNFLLWGLGLSFIIIIEKYVIGDYLNTHPIIGHLYMFLLIPLSWSLFAIQDINQFFLFFSRLFPINQHIWSVFRYDYLKYLQLYYPFFIACFLFSTHIPYRLLKKIKQKWLLCFIIVVIAIACIYCMYKGLDDPFLYFRF